MDEASTGAVVGEGPDTDSGLTPSADDSLDQSGWSLLSEAALQRVWDNDEDARYDNWKELYHLPSEPEPSNDRSVSS